MAFVKFEHKGAGFDPRASISITGRLSLNEGACRTYNLSNFQFVALHYDPEESLIGVELFKEKTEKGLLKLRFRENSGVHISATAFLKYFDIFPEKTAYYDIRLDDERNSFLILDLKTAVARKAKGGDKKK